MKFQLALVFLSLLSLSFAHEKISCWVCGDQTEPEVPPDGICKDSNDQGKNMTCNEEFQSCSTSVITMSKILNESKIIRSAASGATVTLLS